MATTVAKLNIHLGASTGELQKDFQQAEGIVGGFGNKLSGMGADAGGLSSMINPATIAIAGAVAAGAALVAGGYKVASAIGSQMEALDGVAKSADRAGLSMETYQGFALAADMAGVSSGAFATSMNKLQRSLVDARDGTGPAADALRTLGLNVEAVSRMGNDEAMLAIADGIAGISDPAQRTALAMDLFGKAGADMVPLLAGGSAAIREGTDAVEKYNMAISREDAGKIEGANDAWTLFGETIKGIWSQLAVAFAPAVELVGTELADLGGALAGFFKDSGPLIAEFALRVAKMFTDVIDWIAKTVEMMRPWITWLVEVARKMGMIGPETKKAADTAVELTDSWEETANAMKAAAKEAEALAKRGEALTKSLRLPDEIYADTIAELKQLAAAGAITEETFGRGFRKAADELNKATAQAEQTFKPLNVGAVTRNTMAGFSAVIDAQNAQKQLATLAQKQLEEQRKHTRQNDEAIAAFKEIPKVKVASI